MRHAALDNRVSNSEKLTDSSPEHALPLLRFLLSAFDFNCLTAVIGAAGVTRFVREFRGVALGAVNKLRRLYSKVRSSLPGM
jgi:hypothetical protein